MMEIRKMTTITMDLDEIRRILAGQTCYYEMYDDEYKSERTEAEHIAVLEAYIYEELG